MGRSILNMIEKIKSKAHSYACNLDASLTVEFALVSLLFLTLLFSSLEVGRLLYTWNALQYSVEEAARLAVVTANVTEEDIQQFVIDKMPPAVLLNDGNLDVTVTYTTVSSVDFIELQSLYQYQLMGPLSPDSWMNIDLSASSRIPMP